MPSKWIVVANRVHARIFTENPFALVETIKNDLGREKNRALTTDTHALDFEKNPHEDAAVQFAKEIDRHLQRSFELHRFEKLMIIAEPKMMGRIRESLPKTISANCEWLGKDFANMSTQEIGQVLWKRARALTPEGAELDDLAAVL